MTRPTGRAGVVRSLAPALLALASCTGGPGADGTGAPEVLRIVEGGTPTDGAMRVFPADELDRPVGDRVSVAIGDGMLHVRSVREFSLAPVTRGSPLIERTDRNGRPLDGWGSVRETDSGFLGELLNAGWVSPLPDGGAAFAYALEPEVIRFDGNGREVWRRMRPAPASYDPPALVRRGSSVGPEFTEVQHAIASGPDGRLYLLAGATRDSVRVDVLDRNGSFIRAGRVPRGREILVDRKGRVFLGNARAAQTASARRFPDFDLPALVGDERIRLSAYRGRAVVINVWASWCAPCRVEMPALDSLAAEIDSASVVILGLNEDEDPEAAKRFLKSIDGVRYPIAAGGGHLREQFGYPGLPHTVVLDREHRIVDEIRGFGGTLDPIRRAIAAAIEASTGRDS